MVLQLFLQVGLNHLSDHHIVQLFIQISCWNVVENDVKINIV